MSRDLSFHLMAAPSPHRHLVPAGVSLVGNAYVIRTMIPEIPHQVSLARVFRVADLTVARGLARFRLHRGIDYSTDLGASGPDLQEIWVDVDRARSVISSLWQAPPRSLIDLTSPVLDNCWSLFDHTRYSILHNWRLSSISPEAYSTAILLETMFRVDQLEHYSDKSKWIRTGAPTTSSDQQEQDPLDRGILKWAVASAENFLQGHDQPLTDDDWRPTFELVNKLLNLPISKDKEDNDSADTEDSGIAVASAYENLSHLARSRSDARQANRTLRTAQKTRLQYATKAVQTISATEAHNAETIEKSCQTLEVPVAASMNFPWYLVLVIMILFHFVTNKATFWFGQS